MKLLYDLLFLLGFSIFNVGLYYNYDILGPLYFSGAAFMLIALLLARRTRNARETV